MDEEDAGDAQMEQYEGAVAAAAAFVTSFKEVPKAHEDYLDTEPMEAEFYSCDDENEGGKDFSGDIEDDPEMAEMLKMLEDAKGDLEGAPDEDLEQLMQSFDSKDQDQKKKSLKRPPAADQQVPEIEKKAKTQVPEIEKKAKTLDEAILRPVPSFLSGITITPDAEEQGVSFEDDAIVETISTVTKGRAAPPKNRRPPTRKRSQPCDNNNIANNNHTESTEEPDTSSKMPLPSPCLMKKKKKKKGAAPRGGVAMYGGVDLFGGKNPFASRKQDVSSSEDEGAATATSSAATQEAKLRLPFGENDTCDKKSKRLEDERKQKEEELKKAAEEEKKREEAEEQKALEEKKRLEEERKRKAEEE